MNGRREQAEGSALRTIFEHVTHSQDWPIKSGGFVVSVVLDHHFSNFAEDALKQRFGAFTEVDCAPADTEGFTRVNYRLDYSSSTHETSARPDNYSDLDALAS